MKFVDFTLTFKSVGNQLAVSTSDLDGRAIMEPVLPPFSLAQIELLRAKVELEATKTADSTSFRHVQESEADRMLEERGTELFNALFPAKILEAFRQRYWQAHNDQKGLRIRVLTARGDQHLGAYPIEVMYSREAPIGQHLALFGSLTVVRTLEEFSVRQPNPIEPPLNILVVVASPTDLPRVYSKLELENLAAALKLPGIQLLWLKGRSTLLNLINTAVSLKPHILHFIGHGHFDTKTREGQIMLENSSGHSDAISGSVLRGDLANVPSLRLVTLNACLGNAGEGVNLGNAGDGVKQFSAVGTSIASIGIPAVVAMQYRITNAAATEFSKHFYGQLALGRPVDEAMSSTRRYLRHKISGSPEWATPVLYLSTPDGDLFGLRLPADQLLAHAREHLLGGSWETARTIALLLREQHGHDQRILAAANDLAQKAGECELFVEQWLPIQELAKQEKPEGLAERFSNLLELVSGFPDEAADADKARNAGVPDEVALAVAATRAFAKEDFALAGRICDRTDNMPSRAERPQLIDIGFLRTRATAELVAWNEMRRLGEIWNRGDWSRVREALERLDLRGTQQQRLLEKRRIVARELARVTEALVSGDFRRALTMLEHLLPEEAPPNLELARRIAAIGVKVLEAAESSDSKAIAEIGEELEALLRLEESRPDQTEPSRPRIFINYAREDKDTVAQLYKRLGSAGFQPWMDTNDLLAGENWRTSIAKAIRSSDLFLTCLSSRSVSKQGFLQEEIEYALNVWREKFESNTFLIPVRLEDCDPPKSLSLIHRVDLFDASGWELLVKSIREGMVRRIEDRAMDTLSVEPPKPLSVPGLAEVRRSIEEGGRLADYRRGVESYNQGLFTKAKSYFDRLGGYQNSDHMAQFCQSWIEVVQSAQHRAWSEAKRLLEAMSLEEKGTRPRAWIRWCLWARKVVPVLEAMSVGHYVCEPSISSEGRDCPYKLFSKWGVSPSSTMAEAAEAGFSVQTKQGGMSQAERGAWDALRIVENRLTVDFALYTVRDPERARRLAERVCSIEEGKDPGMTTQDVVSELQEDAGVFLALFQNYDSAIKFFIAEAHAHPGDSAILHHLGLTAAAQIHRLEASGGDYQDLATAWQFLIVGWAAVFADDRFWHAFWIARRKCYAAAIGSDQIQNARLRLQRSWLDQTKSAIDIWPGIDTAFQAEHRAARAVQAGKGMPVADAVEGGAVVGLLGVRSLGLSDTIAEWTASFGPKAIQEKGWQQKVCGYFSELAEALVLFDEGRYEKAIAVLGNSRCDLRRHGDERCKAHASEGDPATAAAECPCFAESNPAFSKVEMGADLLSRAAIDLTATAHCKAALEAVSNFPADIRKAVNHWKASVRVSRRRGSTTELLAEIRRVAIGRTKFLLATEGERELDALNDAVELLQSVRVEGWDDGEQTVKFALVGALLHRAVHLSNQYNNEEAARQDASFAYGLAPESLHAIDVLCKASMHFARQLYMRGQRHAAEALISEIQQRLVDGEQRFPGNSDMAACAAWLNELREFVGGKLSATPANPLGELRSPSEEDDDSYDRKIVEAMVKEAQKEFADAIQIYNEILSTGSNNDEVGNRMAYCYRAWMTHLRESEESPQELRRVGREALQRFPDSEVLRDIKEYLDHESLDADWES